MTPPTLVQVRRRRRVESVLRLAAPALDLLLLAGDRLSRAVDRSPGDDAPPVLPPTDARRPLAARRGG